MVADEAERTNTKPRINAECRNINGQSLLSIASQRDDVELASFLLTHYIAVDKDNLFLAEGHTYTYSYIHAHTYIHIYMLIHM